MCRIDYKVNGGKQKIETYCVVVFSDIVAFVVIKWRIQPAVSVSFNDT